MVPSLIKITFLFVYKRTAVEIQFYFVSKQSCNIFFCHLILSFFNTSKKLPREEKNIVNGIKIK